MKSIQSCQEERHQNDVIDVTQMYIALNIFHTFFQCFIVEVEKVNPAGLWTILSLAPFWTPRNHKETKAFLIFLGGIERDQWHEMG